MTAEDAFVVHFRMESGAVGTLQSTSGDWGPPIVITRVVGSEGTAWIEGVGSTVKVADRAGTRTVPVSDDLPTGAGPGLPEGLVTTAYERMISHGMDFGPVHAAGADTPVPYRGVARTTGASGGRLRRRGAADGRAGRRAQVGGRAGVGRGGGPVVLARRWASPPGAPVRQPV